MTGFALLEVARDMLVIILIASGVFLVGFFCGAIVNTKE